METMERDELRVATTFIAWAQDEWGWILLCFYCCGYMIRTDQPMELGFWMKDSNIYEVAKERKIKC